MALPAVAAAGARAGRLGGLLKKRGLPSSKGGAVEKPSILSAEGIIMLMIASMADIANVVLGILDILIGLGTLLSPIVNVPAFIFIGGWQFFRFGKLPIKKAFLPFIGNLIPFAKIIPWWTISVLTCLKKGV